MPEWKRTMRLKSPRRTIRSCSKLSGRVPMHSNMRLTSSRRTVTSCEAVRHTAVTFQLDFASSHCQAEREVVLEAVERIGNSLEHAAPCDVQHRHFSCWWYLQIYHTYIYVHTYVYIYVYEYKYFHTHMHTYTHMKRACKCWFSTVLAALMGLRSF